MARTRELCAVLAVLAVLALTAVAAAAAAEDGAGVRLHAPPAWPATAPMTAAWLCEQAGVTECLAEKTPQYSLGWIRGKTERMALACTYPRGRGTRLARDGQGVLEAQGLDCATDSDDCVTVLEATRAVLMSRVLEELDIGCAKVEAAYTLHGPPSSLDEPAVLMQRTPCDMHIGMLLEVAATAPDQVPAWMAEAARTCLPEVAHLFAPPYDPLSSCQNDDDDDEEDDDEYCHATHADDFYWAAFTRHANLYHVLRIEGLMLATDDVSAIALDGTVLRPDAITTIDATSPRLECDSRGEGVRARITRKAHFEVLASALGLPGGKPKGRPQETSLSDTSRRLRKLGLPSGSETDEQEVVKKLMAMPFYAVDTIRFMRLLAHVSRDEPRPSRHYCPADEDARVAVRDVQALPDGGADREMDRVLDYYRAARRRELANDEDLAKLMNSVNPAFVPREWMVREAALDLLEGSGEEFEKQLAWVADMFNCKVPAAYQSTRIPPLRLPCRAKERPLPFTDECATLSFNMVLEPQLLAARLRGA